MLAAVFEHDVRSAGELFHDVGDEDSPGGRQGGDALGDVDRDAADVVFDSFDFARVKSAADVDAEWSYGLCDGLGGAHGTRWPVERGNEPVTGGLDFIPAEPCQLGPNDRVVVGEDLE